VLLVCQLCAPLPGLNHVLEFGPLVGIGRISYGLYLLHFPILRALTKGGTVAPDVRTILLVLGLSLAAAVVSYYFVERPFLRLKDRLSSGGTTANGGSSRAPSRGGLSGTKVTRNEGARGSEPLPLPSLPLTVNPLARTTTCGRNGFAVIGRFALRLTSRKGRPG